MVVVYKGKGESSESVWRKFGKINYEENLVEELRERKYYRKPSIAKKEIEESRRKTKRRRRSAHV
jgi:ribosomal protein S21